MEIILYVKKFCESSMLFVTDNAQCLKAESFWNSTDLVRQ